MTNPVPKTTDTPQAVEAQAKWHDIEAGSLRMKHARSPAMPELAEVHEETAAMLRRLHARAVDWQDIAERMHRRADALTREAASHGR